MARGYTVKMGRPAGEVRDTRSQTKYGTRPVELVTSDPTGDLIEGHLIVPTRLVGTQKHSSEHAEFVTYVQNGIKRWVEWREHNGWKINSRPRVRGPYDVPVADQDAEIPTDRKLFVITARFKPTRPIIRGLTDMYELERRAAMHGVDLWSGNSTDTGEGHSKAVIYDDTPASDPMVVAEERRKALGVSRNDYLIGSLSEPMSEADLLT